MLIQIKNPKKSRLCIDIDKWMRNEGNSLKHILDKIDGLTIDENFQGTFDLGNSSADVRFEPPGWIRVSSPPVLPMRPDDALRRNHWLPCNLRYAGTSGEMELLADTQVNGMSRLPDCLAEIRRGMSALTDAKRSDRVKSYFGDKSSEKTENLDQNRLKEAIKSLPFGEDCFVQGTSDNGCRAWELRPRLRGEAVPVLVDYVSGGVRIHRTLLDAIPHSGRRAIADQALRLDGQIRFCRFAITGDELVAETLLNAGLIETSWLATAALAVATACFWAKDVLDALARNERAASLYQTIFFNHTVENNFA